MGKVIEHGSKGLPVDKAAEYVGCRSVNQFHREVAQGIWPRPIAPHSRPQRWSIFQLDKALGKHDETTEVEDPHLVAARNRLGIYFR